ncbi:MAG: helix-turn-helix domain-containing protein [Bacteroidales bacterium]|nr:helix-turn-helix domain-containing protein [Bacteroidales bacterium]
MKHEDYIVIQAWMLELGLTDKQLLTYAMIWGYSRDGVSRFRGTARYIAEWIGCTDRHAKRIIRELEDRGLVAHEVTRTMKSTYTSFWAVLPEDAQQLESGSRPKIDWIGRDARVPIGGDISVPIGGDISVPTDILVYNTNSRNIKKCGGKNSARRAQTTTTTGFLFDEDDNGLTAETPAQPALPYSEPYFIEAWEALLKQPRWNEKTPEALKLTLDSLASVYDPVIATYCCRLAIQRGWSFIDNPQVIYETDEQKVLAFADQLRAQEEGARL